MHLLPWNSQYTVRLSITGSSVPRNMCLENMSSDSKP